jgi:hypothetical protein
MLYPPIAVIVGLPVVLDGRANPDGYRSMTTPLPPAPETPY